MADLLELETCTVDLEQGVVLRDARTLKLTTLETRLVRYLCDRLGQDVSRDELLTEVWEYAPTTSSRAVDNTLFRLRRKIEADPKDPVHLQTVYGGGYRLFLRSTEPTPVRPPLPAELDELVGREHEQ